MYLFIYLFKDEGRVIVSDSVYPFASSDGNTKTCRQNLLVKLDVTFHHLTLSLSLQATARCSTEGIQLHFRVC